MNILAVLGFASSPLGKITMAAIAILGFGLWVDISATRRTLAEVEMNRAQFEQDIATIKSDAERLGAQQVAELAETERELADVLEAQANGPDDGSCGIDHAASLRVDAIR